MDDKEHKFSNGMASQKVKKLRPNLEINSFQNKLAGTCDIKFPFNGDHE